MIRAVVAVGGEELPPVGAVETLDLPVGLPEQLVGDEIDEFTPFEIVMMAGDLGERVPPPGDQVAGRIGIEKAEDRERRRQVVDDGGAPEQSGSFHGQSHTAGNGVIPLHVAEVHPVFEVADEPEGVTRIGTGRAECGSRWLRTADLTRAIGCPAAGTKRG